MKYLISILLALVICGCTAVQKKPEVVAYPPPPVNQPLNAYYYFMASRLFKEDKRMNEAVAFMKKAIELDPASFFLKKELALLHMERKEFEKAAEILEFVIAQDPGNVDAIIMLGGIRQDLQQDDEAIRLYELALDANPDRENLFLVLGSIYMEREDVQNAVRVYRKLIQIHEDSFAGRFFLARSLIAMNAFKEAEKELYETLALRPDLVEPRFELIDLYINQPSEFRGTNIPSKVISLYREVLTEQPGNIRAAVELGLFYQENDKTAEAAGYLMTLGQMNDSDADIARFITRQYIDAGQYQKAVVLLEGMLKGASDTSYLHYLCGFAYDNLNAKDKALEHFRKVTPDSRFYRESIFRTAYIHHELGHSSQSIRYLNELIQKEPNNPDYLLYLAIIHEEMEQFGEAEDILKKAIGLSPNSSNLFFRLGVVYDKQNKKKESIEQMKTALRINPEDPNALNYLGYTYAEMGMHLDEAETLIIKALNLKPDDGYITDSLGWVYFQKGEYEKALDILIRAVNLVKNDPVILEHLGDAYEKNGRPDKAIEYYERSLEAGSRNQKDIEQRIKHLRGRGR